MTLQRIPMYLTMYLTKLRTRSRDHRWLLALAIGLASLSAPKMAAAQAPSLELRVAIEDGVGQVDVGSSTKAIVKDSSGRSLGELAAMSAFTAEAANGKVALDRWQTGPVWIEPTANGFVYIGSKWYRGRVLVVPTEKGLTAVNYVDLEQYLYSVLGKEMGKNWPLEALKAQAVAARSYALYQRQHANTIYDVGDTQAWQVYEGIQDESAGTQAAVNQTAGQVLINDGQIIEAVFHSSAGGCTENVEDVWMQPLPYLRSVKEPFQEMSNVARWEETVARSQFSNLVGGVGNVESVEIVGATPCGRVKSVRLTGDEGSRVVSGETLRSALNLKSTLFTIERPPTISKAKTQSTPNSFVIKGRGFGHGLGLSQWGAYTMALQQRANYQAILSLYYKNTRLAKIQVR